MHEEIDLVSQPKSSFWKLSIPIIVFLYFWCNLWYCWYAVGFTNRHRGILSKWCKNTMTSSRSWMNCIKWDWEFFSNAFSLNLNIIVIKLLANNHIMIVEPMVPRGLPRKDSINPLSKKTKSRNPHLLQGEVVQFSNKILGRLKVAGRKH